MSHKSQPTWRILIWPMVVALLTAVGLFAALLGDGVWDSLAWLGLGVSAALGLQGFYPRPRQ
ncbi:MULTISPECIES: hypothetical protein [Pseudomonas]|uniref:DUF4175 domain-containing protein n=1 Tax=Pseudomonas plecoglossicida TaxID=70775 RepID=A0ABX4U4N7_PSEDL|nr:MULTISPECIES: hypothetical protein [Pseudomonas]KYC25028.1 hypothetical protein WM94_07745 [Pseudomonas sp. ABFPK]MBA6112031.1 hypothetical protein [Pseudomonas asiatica]PLU88495.1 hypothetical protein CXG44_05510 [Pseudomonas plecoglossicida]PLU93706.1 hypothetical protein CXG45_08935 [Pseudomonas plecoglossicida]PLV04459.1 hypothetical protein CXG48_08795 [Pseudomonas plecoglossicida]